MNKKIYFLVIGLLVLSVLITGTRFVLAGYTTSDQPSVTMSTYRTYEFFASSTPFSVPTTVATTTSATSTNITSYIDNLGRVDNGYVDISGAKKVTLLFGRGGATSANTGSSTFSVQVSPNGTDWYNWNKLIQNSATTTANITTLSSVVIEAATSTVTVGMDLRFDTFKDLRCIVVEATDGEHRCRADIEY